MEIQTPLLTFWKAASLWIPWLGRRLAATECLAILPQRRVLSGLRHFPFKHERKTVLKTGYFLNFLKGLGMGMADVVPGVSGGTVALLTGIYQQLVLSISRFDKRLLGMVVARRFGEALEYVQWKFLGSLGLGIGLGFVIAIKSLGYYLDQVDVRGYILSSFFGMIIAASVIVWRMIPAISTTTDRSRLLMAGAGV